MKDTKTNDLFIMLSRNVLFWLRRQKGIYNGSRRYYSSVAIRNIGILAHIDAGKTTTTERMLFYSGKTNTLGEVHRGNTVTDYLAQERERGITICSSAVSFQWNNKNRINLLDTPGHIDFTMEVEQALHAVDGVIVVLDGTAGVEAQTMTVWEQSNKMNLPKIIFVNKMDRPDADYEQCLQDLKDKFSVVPVALQYPQKDESGNLSVLDIVRQEHVTWNAKTLGRTFTVEKLTESNNLFLEALEKRHELIDRVSGVDDELAELIIKTGSFENLPNDVILKALKRATCQNKILPVLLGSAYKNVGIQHLMNAVVEYLPAPNERNQLYDCFEDNFVGKVFKIVHDKQRGALTLVRVFRGELKKGMKIIRSYASHGSSEIVQKLYEPLADEYREINSVQSGDIAICSGLKNTCTGDLITSSSATLKSAQKKLKRMVGNLSVSSLNQTTKNDDDLVEDAESEPDANKENDLINEVFGLRPQIPDAVYFCSIEPPSPSTQTAMEIALKQLQREDPSLRVTYNEATGQTVLGGMGELHMEIIRSRILTEYKIDVYLGALQIAYKETIKAPGLTTFTTEKEIAGQKQSVTITLELLKDQKEIFSLNKSPESAENLANLRPRFLQMIRRGAVAALDFGPKVSGKVIDTQICLHHLTMGRHTADSFLAAAASQCVRKILTEVGTIILEPIMSLQIIVPSERVSSILADLSRRRSIINDILAKGQSNKLILVEVPLAELSGYSTMLRTISSGTASVTMQPCGFSHMNERDEAVAIRRAQGFE